MNKTEKTWRQAHRPTTRRLVQLYSALLHNAYLKGFIEGEIYKGNAKYVCVPGLNCYSCPGAVGACPLGALQNALSSARHRAGWYVLGIILLYGVILGRTICGWLCPFGLLQELLHRIPTLKIKKSRITRALSRLKYILLLLFVIAIPLYYGLYYDVPLPAFCKYICPAGTFEGSIGLLVNPANTEMFGTLGILFTRKFIIMLMIALACILCYRSFCRFLCPLGAIYGLFNRFNVIGVQVDPESCNHCGACVRSCGMDVRCVGDSECIHCGKCMSACRQDAISIRAGKIILKAPEEMRGEKASDARKKSRRLRLALWGLALAVLCLVLLRLNMTGHKSEAPVGHEVGEQLEDFTLTCYDGSQFHLADTRGKITFINFWAVYCAPCIQELPSFSALYEEHAQDIAMIAIHPKLITTDPMEFLSDKDFSMPFATDIDDTVMNIVGGTGTLPQTIVLNRRGEIIYNQVGSVTPELLAALYEEADQ